MQLNQTSLRGILAAILSVNEKYIVLKQGNWWNPQKAGANIANWCGYRIKENKPRTAPFFHEIDDKNCCVVLKCATIELQFVGPRSEEIAQSVSMWSAREDVKEAFETVHGAILYDDLTAIPSDFYQDGLNTITAWNIPNLRVLWYDILETTQTPLQEIDIGGNVD